MRRKCIQIKAFTRKDGSKVKAHERCFELDELTEEQKAKLERLKGKLSEGLNLSESDIDELDQISKDSDTLKTAIERNGGNPMELTIDGQPSKLHASLLEEAGGDKELADFMKAQVYSDEFKEWFGDWQGGDGLKSDAKFDRYDEIGNFQAVRDFSTKRAFDIDLNEGNVSADTLSSGEIRQLVENELGIKVVFGATGNSNFAQFDGDKITFTKEDNSAVVVLHEIGEELYRKLDKAGVVKFSDDITRSITIYGANQGNDAFADSFAYYTLQPDALKSLSPKVYNELDSIIPEEYKQVSQKIKGKSNYSGVATFNTPNNTPSSKVVDENGEPLMVYHGTNIDFEEFNIDKLGNASGNQGWFGAGFYFTPLREVARGYAKNASDGLSQLPLSKEELRRYKEWAFNNKEKGFDYLKVIEKVQTLRDNASRFVVSSFLNIKNPQMADISEGVVDQGFKVNTNSDGALIDNSNLGLYEVVVRNPNQIKSIYNDGTFSTSDNNIYGSKIDKIRKGTQYDGMTVREIMSTPDGRKFLKEKGYFD